METKMGVYICTGCGLGDALDIDALAGVATGEYKAPVCRQHAFLCSAEGVGQMKADIEGEGVNALVIAACSPRVMTDVFDFGPDKVLERVNLREQVAWTHPANDEDTQMMAEDQLRMGLTKAKEMQPLEPFMAEDLSKRILVVGGGLAGMTAANEAAKAGYEVVLVEKSDQLGGYLKDVYKMASSQPPYDELRANVLEELTQEVTGRAGVKVYTNATIGEIAGAPCLFDVKIKQNGGEAAERAGAIIMATGAVPYDASKLENLGFGKHADVITAPQLEAMFKAGSVTRPSNGQPVGSAAFVLCAGSRDAEHLPYCSAACCVESLKQAKYFKEANPETPVYVFYKDIRANGNYELLYKQLQKDGVFFVRGTVTSVEDDGAGSLVISADDVLTRSPMMSESIDLVVLATGMIPTSALGEPFKAQAPKEGEEKAEVPADTILASNILNLQYRQGPELPALKYGYPDSHFVCFPYESRRTGIYPAGSVRAPMDYSRAVDDATGAALKAIQCVEMVSQGKALHPRAGDMSYPDFFMQRCTQCKRCTEECPFGAIKNINVPDEYDEKPRIIVLACENDAYPAIDMAGIRRMSFNAWVRFVPVRCLGSMNLVWIADALSKGIDGIMLLGCKHGDDYQCHFVKGSELANIRMTKIQETLDRLRLESDRVYLEQLSISEYKRIPEVLDAFAEKIQGMDPNPYKGF